MSVEETLLDAEERMEKAVGRLKGDLAGIRTGRANPGMVDSLKVEVYGSPTPVKQIASVSAPEPQQLVIRPFDPGTIKDIEKGIIASDLGLAPQSDGKVIRLNIPALSGEVRKKMVARTKDLAEESKVSIRNVRRDANKALDQLEKDKELSEDECKTYKDDVQELTNKYEGQVTELAKTKEAEVLDE
ncbi:Ribosome-recycling factor [Posidoniimonas polymericola]|uniref:Ribosome-recycling factor n=1 Tax=Posidoniimonas polymericola TaxID=2528002 RepID=A0A5C5YFF4_9BACT|nr:ribosome recycling factor [Posidoniimonas polymericola]TWT74457.1 Ribosome-recycling factor [Posidoniimonas polymericola]